MTPVARIIAIPTPLKILNNLIKYASYLWYIHSKK